MGEKLIKVKGLAKVGIHGVRLDKGRYTMVTPAQLEKMRPFQKGVGKKHVFFEVVEEPTEAEKEAEAEKLVETIETGTPLDQLNSLNTATLASKMRQVGLNPKDYSGKQAKIDALIAYAQEQGIDGV